MQKRDHLIQERPDDRPNYEYADRVVEDVRDSNGDLVLQLDRIGATPYLRFTPYTNHRGVRVHMWSCVAITAKPMPERTLLFHPRIINPARLENYNVRMFTTEWVKKEARQSRYISTVPVEDTPFGGEMMWWDADE